jgi:hypothetical protein
MFRGNGAPSSIKKFLHQNHHSEPIAFNKADLIDDASQLDIDAIIVYQKPQRINYQARVTFIHSIRAELLPD